MSSRTVEARFASHCSAARQGSKFRFHSAIRKYGVDCWNLAILEENDDLAYIRKREYELIDELSPEYNAKRGGSGGWVVPEHLVDEWKLKLSKATKGNNNPNSSKLTNEDLKIKLIEASRRLGRVPSSKAAAAKEIPGFPKHFTKFRYDGDYRNLANEVSVLTGLPYYNRSNKSPEHRVKIGMRHKK